MPVAGFGAAVWLSLAALPVVVAIVALSLGEYEQLFNINRKRSVVCWPDSAPTWSFFWLVCVACVTKSPALPHTAMPSTVTAAAAGIGVCSLAGMALVCRDIGSKMKGDNRTFGSLLSQYVAVKVVGWLGERQRRKLEADTRNVGQVQLETLLKRLSKNANTHYGREYDFSSMKGEAARARTRTRSRSRSAVTLSRPSWCNCHSASGVILFNLFVCLTRLPI